MIMLYVSRAEIVLLMHIRAMCIHTTMYFYEASLGNAGHHLIGHLNDYNRSRHGMLAAQICGEANVGVIREAAQAGVPRCAFISAHDYQFPGTKCCI